MSMLKKFLENVLVAFHWIISIGFYVFFFIPSSVFPLRIEVHAAYTVFTFLMFYVWGMYWTLKLKDGVYSVCWITSITQKLRGYDFMDERNYKHRFISEEIFGRFSPFLSRHTSLINNVLGTAAVVLFLLKFFFGIVIY